MSLIVLHGPAPRIPSLLAPASTFVASIASGIVALVEIDDTCPIARSTGLAFLALVGILRFDRQVVPGDFRLPAFGTGGEVGRAVGTHVHVGFAARILASGTIVGTTLGSPVGCRLGETLFSTGVFTIARTVTRGLPLSSFPRHSVSPVPCSNLN